MICPSELACSTQAVWVRLMCFQLKLTTPMFEQGLKDIVRRWGEVKICIDYVQNINHCLLCDCNVFSPLRLKLFSLTPRVLYHPAAVARRPQQHNLLMTFDCWGVFMLFVVQDLTEKQSLNTRLTASPTLTMKIMKGDPIVFNIQ